MTETKKKSLADNIGNIILYLGFGLMLASALFAGTLTPLIGTYMNYIMSPLTSIMPFYIIVLVIVAIVSFYINFLQMVLVDWNLVRRVTDKSRAMQTEMREAQLSGNKTKMKKLQEDQLGMMSETAEMQKQYMKPMGFTVLISMPLFLWAAWYTGQHMTMSMVFPFWGNLLLSQRLFGIMPYWTLWSFICSLLLSTVIRKVFNVGISI